MQKIRIKIKAYDSKMADKAAVEIVGTAQRTGSKTAGPIPLPTQQSKIAVMKSPFKYGDAMDHFEIKTHKRLIEIIEPNPKTIDALTHLQLAAGVSLEIK